MHQWTCAQIAATIVWSTSNSQLEGTIGRVADTAHTVSCTTRRSHLNLLWIHIMLSTPMIYKLCRFISRSNMESLKPTPRVTFETWGLRWHDSANLASFSKFKNPRTMEGKDNLVQEATVIWRPLENFWLRKYMTVTKSRLNEEVPGHQKGFRFKIRLKGSQSHWSSQISGLQSGSREICSPTKLWSAQIRFKNVRFKKELTSRKFEFKGRQKISGWKWRFRFKIRFKGKMSPPKHWSSQYPI